MLKKLMIIMLVFTFMCTTAYATKLNINYEGSMVEISGTLASGATNKIITIQVVQKGVTLVQVDQAPDLLIYAGQTLSIENGDYIFDFPFNVSSGHYTYFMNVQGAITTSDFYFLNKNDVDEFIVKINADIAVGNKTDIVTLINDYSAMLNLQLPTLAMPADMNRIAEYIINSGSVSNSSAFLQRYSEGLAIESFHSGSLVNAATLYTAFGNTLNLNTSIGYNTYMGLSKYNGKEAVLTKIVGNNVATLSEFQALFNKTAVLTAVNISSWVDINSIIVDNNAFLNFSLSDYLNLDDHEVVDRQLAGKNYSSIAEFKSDFEKFVATAKTNESASTVKPIPSSGGGNSSSFTTNVNSIPVVSPGTHKFTDIGMVQWAEASINYLADLGAVNGKSSTNFAPLDNVTREEFVKILLISFGIKPDSNATCSFLDVNQDQWYYPYVVKAFQMGVIQGAGDVFGVGKNITRQDMATILYRVAVAMNKITPEKAPELTFADSSNISEYALQSIETMVKLRVLSGMGDNTFVPQESANRAQAACMIYNLIKE